MCTIMVLYWTHIGIVLGPMQHKIGPIIEIYNLHMDLLMGVSNTHIMLEPWVTFGSSKGGSVASIE